jgi:hypothetical protein
MAKSVTEICNMALVKLGQNRIINITDNNDTAAILNHVYEMCRDEVIESHHWSCATKYATLAQLATSDADYDSDAEDKWEYQYRLPADFARVVEMTSALTADYEIDGDRLMTNEDEDVVIKYIYYLTDVSKMSAMLRKTIAYRLASEIAFDVTNSERKAQEMTIAYETQLHRAQGIDAYSQTAPQTLGTDLVDAGR